MHVNVVFLLISVTHQLVVLVTSETSEQTCQSGHLNQNKLQHYQKPQHDSAEYRVFTVRCPYLGQVSVTVYLDLGDCLSIVIELKCKGCKLATL